ncbi:MAG: V-type ATP synthase subunit D [Phycisphaerae bacterium]
MAKKKIRLTRPELRRQREMLRRFERYLPMLKLKQQQLQLTMRKLARQRSEVASARDEARDKFAAYENILADLAGVNVEKLAEPEEVHTEIDNVAGLELPRFEDIRFPEADYSLFATPAWVDQALADLRDVNRLQAELDVLEERYELLEHELTKVIQRVNLFEKVMIPQCRENIRRIRIKLDDEQTAGVARAKIAKEKLAETEMPERGGEQAVVVQEEGGE